MTSAPTFSDSIIAASTAPSASSTISSASTDSFPAYMHLLHPSETPLWRRRDVPVFVNVYDLHPYNQYVNCLGLGAYHSGIEIFGREYSYGFHQWDTTGVFDNAPRMAFGAVFNTSVFLGTVHLSEADFESILRGLRIRFLGCDYDILSKNCNTFSEELVRCLGMKSHPVPGYVNRLAWIAKAIRCCLPRTFIRPQDVIDADQAFIQPPTAILQDDGRQKLKGSVPVMNYQSTGSTASLAASMMGPTSHLEYTSIQSSSSISAYSSTSSSASNSGLAVHASPAKLGSDSFESAWSDPSAAYSASKSKSRSPPPSAGAAAALRKRFDAANTSAAAQNSLLLLKHAAQSPSQQVRRNAQKRLQDEKTNDADGPVLPNGDELEENDDDEESGSIDVDVGISVSEELRAQKLKDEFSAAAQLDQDEQDRVQASPDGGRSDEEKNPFLSDTERRNESTQIQNVNSNDEGQVNPFEHTPSGMNDGRIQRNAL